MGAIRGAISRAYAGTRRHFGWSLAAVYDCFQGRFGAVPSPTIYWDHSSLARQSLSKSFVLALDNVFLSSDVDLILR
jgi:hypothetical protein